MAQFIWRNDCLAVELDGIAVPDNERRLIVPAVVGRLQMPLDEVVRHHPLSGARMADLEVTNVYCHGRSAAPYHHDRILSRPRWFDVCMWGRPLDTCMLDVRFREKFQDAMAVVVSDQERAVSTSSQPAILTWTRTWQAGPGTTILCSTGTDSKENYLQPEETTARWLHYPPGTLLNEIYTGWRWPHVNAKGEHVRIINKKVHSALVKRYGQI